MSSGGGDTTTVQQADPWSGVQTPLKDYYNALSQWFYGYPAQGTGVQPGSTTLAPSAQLLPKERVDQHFSEWMNDPSNWGKWKGLPALAEKGTDLIDPYTGKPFTQSDWDMGMAAAGQGSTVPSWLSQSMVAPVSPYTTMAQNLMAERALSGGGLTGLAQGAVAGGLSGVNPAMSMYAPMASGANIYDNPIFGLMGQTAMGGTINPYLNQMYGTAAGKVGQSFQDIVMPSIASRYGLAGRTGSGAEQQAYEGAFGQLGETLSGLASNIYGQGYEAERARQMQAAQSLGQAYTTGTAQQMGAIGGMGDAYSQMMKDRLLYSQLAPSMAYADISPLFDIGAQQQAYQQQIIDAPLQRLQALGSLLQPGLGFGTTTSQTPYYTNPTMGTLGGAAAGYQMGGPWGALIGAGLGYASSQ